MLVFIDEAGDTGRKLDQGSSRYFIVALVLFRDHGDAESCDERIALLRKELKLPADFEFHFTQNSRRVREAFLQAMQPYQFVYFAVVIDKDPEKLWGPGFQTKGLFYNYACQMVMTNAEQHLDRATVVIDRSGSPDFRKHLSRYLSASSNANGTNKVRKIKQQRSHTNNLLQLADYVAGVVNRRAQGKSDWQDYYRYLRAKEAWVQTWPK